MAKRAASSEDRVQKNARTSDGNTRDQFYTLDSVALQCGEYLARVMVDATPRTVVEPSAGAGAFCRAVRATFPSALLHALDIEPADPTVAHGDFFAYELPADTERPCWVVGNPPFGFRSALVVRFFNMAAQFADVIAFIVPLTLRRPAFKNQLDQRFDFLGALPLEGACFTRAGDDNTVSVPTEFQVWQRRSLDVPRALEPYQIDTRHLRFLPVSEAASADFLIQRVGRAAGRVHRDRAYMDSHALSQNYFRVAFVDRVAAEWARQHQFNWEACPEVLACAGQPSLSKVDITMWFAEQYTKNL